MKTARQSVIDRIVPAAAAVFAIVAVAVWLGRRPPHKLEARVPGRDKANLSQQDGGTVKGTLVVSDGVPAKLPGSWPRFRGKNFDNISDEDVRLARSWPPEGPPVLWAIDVGEGYAGAAVQAGRVYVLDYDRENQADALRCLSLADGKEIWRYSYPVRVKRNHGMSRTVPAVTDKYVVSLGPKCHVTCLDSTTGEFRWAIDLVREYGTKVPMWYAGQCPLIDRGRAILGVGGTDVLMMAVNCETGQVVWKTPNPNGWVMTHSSIVPMEFQGRRMYVYCAGNGRAGGVVGVSAEDGEVLWETDAWKIVVNVPSPVIVGEGRIFLSGGYNAGSMLLQLVPEGDKLAVKVVSRFKARQFGAVQQTPIFYKGYLYGVLPRDVGAVKEQLVCMDLEGQRTPDRNTGRSGASHVWTSGREHRFGLGPFLIADGLIFLMNDEGVLTLAEATPAGYNQLAQAKVLNGHDSWGPMAIAAGRLIVRDLTRMVCLDVRAR